MHVHPDSASLEYHMEVAGPVFRQFVELVTLSSIHLYGEPSEKLLKQLHEKSRLLGARRCAGGSGCPARGFHSFRGPLMGARESCAGAIPASTRLTR